MHIIPQLKSVETAHGHCQLSDDLLISINDQQHHQVAAKQLLNEVYDQCSIRAHLGKYLPESIKRKSRIDLHIQADLENAYHINITSDRIAVTAKDAANLYYAVQSLRQLIQEYGRNLPVCSIKDDADFPIRGLYHDITRGKMPTFDTMAMMVEKCAFYKINQLQLYIEHTYDFQAHLDIAAGKSPITADEILELDELCKKHFIDLVPSLTTFGHCYEILRCKRLEHLCELDLKGSDYPYSWWDRQAHFTVDSKNPDAFVFIDSMLDEYLPLFSSEHFNICCDETLDLECGRNGDASTSGERYIDFTKKVIASVVKRGKKPQMWGDILQKHPEHIKDIPKDCTVLNWAYDPGLRNGDCKPFADAGLNFYVCPGTSGWSQFFANVETASQNIYNFAVEGLKHGATGLLNTDWGDYGHPGLFGASLHGIALGADCAWNTQQFDQTRFDEAFSSIELGDRSHEAAALMREFSTIGIFTINHLASLFDPMTDIPVEEEWLKYKYIQHERLTPKHYKPEEDFSVMAASMRTLRDRFSDCLHKAGSIHTTKAQEMLCGMWGQILVHEASHLIQISNDCHQHFNGLDYFSCADEWRMFEQVYSELWHRSNKPSEYSKIRDFIIKLADLLDSCGLKHQSN